LTGISSNHQDYINQTTSQFFQVLIDIWWRTKQYFTQSWATSTEVFDISNSHDWI